MTEVNEELLPRPSTRIVNKDTTSPSTSKGKIWVPSLLPEKEEKPPTFLRDLLNAQLRASNKE